ncbi:MAG: hypothetical protein ACI4SY_05990, partial [Sutterella sp.]
DWLSLPPLPNTSGIAALRFDLNPSADQAAPWLFRLMVLLFATVILPRCLLALWDTVLLSRSKRSISLPLNSPYYRSILSKPNIVSCWTGLIIDASDPADADQDRVLQLKQDFSAACIPSKIAAFTYNTWEGTPDLFIAQLPSAQRYQLALIIDPVNTPEDEVHGSFIETAASWCRDHHSPAVAVILDCSSMQGRQGNTDARLALWETFIAEKHGVAMPADLSSPEDRKNLIESLSALWH